MKSEASAAGHLILAADPHSNYAAHKKEIDHALHQTLDRGRYILGQEVKAFEDEFAQFIGVRHAVGVASGTDALELALRACGIGAGDLVATVSNTAVATVAAIELAGAAPVLVDIDDRTFTMDPQCLEDAAKKHDLKAVILVHLYGQPADLPAILAIAKRKGIVVIEDCAQSHGAGLSGRRTGSWGRVAAFSFYPTKNLGAIGDGGAVLTDDPGLGERLRRLREYGWRERYVSDIPGMNSRLDEIQAAVLRVKLRYLDRENELRRKWAARYQERLKATRLLLPFERQGSHHVYHQYVVRSQSRDALQTVLKAEGIQTLIHYPIPVHRQPAYRRRLKLGPSGLSRTEAVVSEILSLPMHPQMTADQIDRIASAVARREAVC